MVRKRPTEKLIAKKYRRLKRFSILYELLRWYIWFYHDFIWYKKVHRINTHNIPKRLPVIFAANHQNAVADAFAIGLASSKQPVFAARADVFKNPIIASILRWLKIMPLFSTRDGFEQMQTNNAIFKVAADILKNNNPFVILPEGNHSKYRRLRPLKKSVGRIAFLASEITQFEPGIQIVPVGIDFSDYIKPQSELTVRFGVPIPVNDYLPLYQENKGKALNLLRNDLANAIKGLMIHIESIDYYECIDVLREVSSNEFRNKKSFKRPEILEFQQVLIQNFEAYIKEAPSNMDVLNMKALEYRDLLNKFDLRDYVIQQKEFSYLFLSLGALGMLLLLPLHLYGLLFMYWPYKLTDLLGERMTDSQYKSSVKIISSALLFPVYILIIHTIAAGIISPFYFTFLFTISIIVAGIFSFNYWIWYRKLNAKFRFENMKIRHRANYKRMIHLREQLIAAVRIIGKFDDMY